MLCGGVPSSLVRDLKCWRPELDHCPKVYGSLATLAMGDTQAVVLAQTCHLGIGMQSGHIQPRQLLTLRGPLPRAKDMVGIVIDDFISLSVCPADEVAPSNWCRDCRKDARRIQAGEADPS